MQNSSVTSNRWSWLLAATTVFTASPASADPAPGRASPAATTGATPVETPSAASIAIPAGAPPETEVSTIGGVDLEIGIPRTAFFFHAVDALAEWNPGYQPAYHEWLDKSGPLDAEGKALLERHRALRKARKDRGFELTYFTDDTLAVAEARAQKNRWLTADELTAEHEILTHFAPRFDPLYAQNVERLSQLRERLFARDQTFGPLLAAFSRFVGGAPAMPLTLELVPKPEGRDGWQYESWRSPILVEMPDGTRDGDFALVPLLGAFLETRHAEIAATAASCGGDLRAGELQSAIRSSILGDVNDQRDAAADLRADVARSPRRSDGSLDPWMRQRRLGIVLRKEIHAAMKKGSTLVEVLPSVCAPWKKLIEDHQVPERPE